MRTVSLQQICDIQIGRTPSRSVPEYWGGELPWVTISDLAKDRIVKTTKERITRIGAAKSRSKWIPRGTLLLSFKLSLGKRAIAGCDLFTNEAIAALRVLDHDIADRDYLYWALGSIDYDRLVDRAAKGRTLNKAKLKLLQIPLPPLTEQKRIAGILDAADALRAKRREALDQLDILLQSTFLDMFGDPVTNPMSWPEVALGAHTSKIGSGATPLGGEAAYKKNGIALIRSKNVHDGHFSQHGLAFIDDQQAARLDGVVVELDDVLLNITGASVARVCRAPRCVLPARVNQHVAIIRSTNGFDQRFLEQCLLFPSMKRWLLRIAGAGATREAITKDAIKRLMVIQPPRNEQDRIAAIVQSVERQKARQRAHLAELDTLFASLQSRAFRGDL